MRIRQGGWLMMHWGEACFIATDRSITHCGNSSSNASSACSPRGVNKLRGFLIFTAIVRGVSERPPRLAELTSTSAQGCRTLPHY